jgi:hypothetical protein
MIAAWGPIEKQAAAPETKSPAQLMVIVIDRFTGYLPLDHDRDGADNLLFAQIRLP